MVLLKTWICTRITDITVYSVQQIQIRKSNNYGWGTQVGEIFRMKKCLLNVWEAMKGDAYMNFAVIQLIPLFNKSE